MQRVGILLQPFHCCCSMVKSSQGASPYEGSLAQWSSAGMGLMGHHAY